MNKKYFAFLMVGLMIFVFGCGAKEEVVTSESPYIGGSNGIIAEFLDMGVYDADTGMEEIFEDETFPIEIMLKNKGEEDVDAGMVTITLKGISLNDFSGIVVDGVLSNTEMIEKVSEYNSVGGEITLDFTPETEDAKYLIDLTGALYDINVFADVVYNYKTHSAVPQVCFKENPQQAGVCEIDEMKTIYSSGAPITVNSAEEKRAGTGKIAVEFKVENVGGGDVTKPGTEFNVRYDQLSFSSSDDAIWECKAAGRLNEGRFDTEGKMTIICKLKEAMEDNTLYTKELDLTLDYDYKELIQRSIRVRQQ